MHSYVTTRSKFRRHGISRLDMKYQVYHDHLHDNFQVHPMQDSILWKSINIMQTTIQRLVFLPSCFDYLELLNKGNKFCNCPI